jgi:phosphatidylglycerophosphatase A
LYYSRRVDRFVASWFGTGLLLGRIRGSDAGSGTVGAAFALIPAVALGLVGWWAQLAGALLVAAASLWSTRRFAQHDGDPGWIVVDEAAGTFLAVIGLNGWSVAVAFVVFRVADISKRFPGVAAAERLGGALGITADDLMAGLWALGAGWVTQAVL